MKRTVAWRDEEDDDSSEASSDDDSSTSDTGIGDNKVESAKRKSKGIDFEALSRHGYKGGLSVLKVPPPKESNDHKHDWSWSTGQETRVKEVEETYKERQRTRAAIIEGEQLENAQTQKEKKNVSYSQREKKKRDLGQSSRGKNYVEEEKRLLRDNGIYSGFDS